MPEYTRFPEPLSGEMRPMDLHLGVVRAVLDDGAEAGDNLVAIMLQRADAQSLAEPKYGYMVAGWPELMQVITGLIGAGREAWGDPVP